MWKPMAMWFGDSASLLLSLPSNLGKGLVISTYELGFLRPLPGLSVAPRYPKVLESRPQV
jgi:hypothetical protein